MQPQANRERIIIRTSLAPKLPQVVADARSLRQIVLNLLSNSIKFTDRRRPGDRLDRAQRDGEVVLRVRDTGIGMSEKELATALEPFRQVATATRRPRSAPASACRSPRRWPRRTAPASASTASPTRARWSRSRSRPTRVVAE